MEEGFREIPEACAASVAARSLVIGSEIDPCPIVLVFCGDDSAANEGPERGREITGEFPLDGIGVTLGESSGFLLSGNSL